jgi:hypothetical protein
MVHVAEVRNNPTGLFAARLSQQDLVAIVVLKTKPLRAGARAEQVVLDLVDLGALCADLPIKYSFIVPGFMFSCAVVRITEGPPSGKVNPTHQLWSSMRESVVTFKRRGHRGLQTYVGS